MHDPYLGYSDKTAFHFHSNIFVFNLDPCFVVAVVVVWVCSKYVTQEFSCTIASVRYSGFHLSIQYSKDSQVQMIARAHQNMIAPPQKIYKKLPPTNKVYHKRDLQLLKNIGKKTIMHCLKIVQMRTRKTPYFGQFLQSDGL